MVTTSTDVMSSITNISCVVCFEDIFFFFFFFNISLLFFFRGVGSETFHHERSRRPGNPSRLFGGLHRGKQADSSGSSVRHLGQRAHVPASDLRYRNQGRRRGHRHRISGLGEFQPAGRGQPERERQLESGTFEPAERRTGWRRLPIPTDFALHRCMTRGLSFCFSMCAFKMMLQEVIPSRWI